MFDVHIFKKEINMTLVNSMELKFTILTQGIPGSGYNFTRSHYILLLLISNEINAYLIYQDFKNT